MASAGDGAPEPPGGERQQHRHEQQQHGEVGQHGLDPAALRDQRLQAGQRPGVGDQLARSTASRPASSGSGSCSRRARPSARPRNTPSDAAWSAVLADRPDEHRDRRRDEREHEDERRGRQRVAPRDAEHERRHDDDVGRLEQRDAEAGRAASPATIVAARRRRRHHPPRDAQPAGDDERSDAVIDVRNMNITSWVDAPNVNCVKPANEPGSPTRLTVDRDAGHVGVAGLGGGPAPGPSPRGPRRSATRAAVAIAAMRAAAASTGARSPLGERARSCRGSAARPSPVPRSAAAKPSGITRPASSLPCSTCAAQRRPRRRSRRTSRRVIVRCAGSRPGPPRPRRRPARRPRAARAVEPPNWSPRATMIIVGSTNTKNRSPRSRSWRMRLTRPIASALPEPLIGRHQAPRAEHADRPRDEPDAEQHRRPPARPSRATPPAPCMSPSPRRNQPWGVSSASVAKASGACARRRERAAEDPERDRDGAARGPGGVLRRRANETTSVEIADRRDDRGARRAARSRPRAAPSRRRSAGSSRRPA